MTPQIGPFFPTKDRPIVYCMVGDEPLMFAPYEKLAEREREHLEMMESDIISYSMATILLSKENDRVVLQDKLLTFKDFFTAHIALYKKAGVEVTSQLYFTKRAQLYPKALEIADKESLITSVCYSYELNRFCKISTELEISKQLNSKIALCERAKKEGFLIPKTEVFSKKALLDNIEEVVKTFNTKPFMVKADGLGGGFNVATIQNPADLKAFITPFKEGEKFILQERLEHERFNELAVDFVIRDDEIILYNARKKLVDHSQWFGNVYYPNIPFSPAQLSNLNKCLEGIRSLGYTSKWGNICSLDVFQNKDEHYITEINGRWSGGFPIAFLLKRMGLENQGRVVSFVDSLSIDQLEAYIDFSKKNLVHSNDSLFPGDFKVFPVGFNPKVEEGMIAIWLLIFGDFDHFTSEVKKTFKLPSFQKTTLIQTFLKNNEG
ncbi:hypothetical protein [Candidatus Neptunochlamydia vexilliferae]|uniref:hypothetical protein n=1 Tax=Candidatus Neptunichlamydia vexilliferae TaxID=1651774 RepID=UPI0018916270|nr:hypothetical protein [Candidatus Neptunochlamydia vexilliferae]